LTGTRIGGQAGALALASAQGWDHLRSLDLTGTGIDNAGLLALLSSPNLQRLTCLGLGDGWHRGDPALDISPDVADAFTRLPHLANLDITVGHCDPRGEQALAACESLAWLSITAENE